MRLKQRRAPGTTLPMRTYVSACHTTTAVNPPPRSILIRFTVLLSRISKTRTQQVGIQIIVRSVDVLLLLRATRVPTHKYVKYTHA